MDPDRLFHLFTCAQLSPTCPPPFLPGWLARASALLLTRKSTVCTGAVRKKSDSGAKAKERRDKTLQTTETCADLSTFSCSADNGQGNRRRCKTFGGLGGQDTAHHSSGIVQPAPACNLQMAIDTELQMMLGLASQNHPFSRAGARERVEIVNLKRSTVGTQPGHRSVCHGAVCYTRAVYAQHC